MSTDFDRVSRPLFGFNQFWTSDSSRDTIYEPFTEDAVDLQMGTGKGVRDP
jgi:hypothetical protein